MSRGKKFFLALKKCVWVPNYPRDKESTQEFKKAEVSFLKK